MRNVAAAGALVVGVVLTGCGHTSHPQVQPDLAGKPTWAGCQERSASSIDYGPGARGKPTALAALASYRTPGDHVVRQPGGDPPELTDWVLVDDHQVIQASLELEHVRYGWLVGFVEKCSD
jgi:hypothetical protein